MTRSRYGMLLSGLLVLSACGDDTDPAQDRSGDQGGEASGEILGGTISDDMIPLAELRSQSPPAEPTAQERASSSSVSENEEQAPANDGPTAPTPEAESAPADPASADISVEE